MRQQILRGELDINEVSPSSETRALLQRARKLCSDLDVLHWSLAFPEVFLRDRPGFDVIVANPPWEEVTVEELGFYTRYLPGLKSETSGRNQRQRIAEFSALHPEVRAGYERALGDAEIMRKYLRASFELTRSGDPDLYKAFAERFLGLVRSGGSIGVVLPRTAFAGQGTEPFRARLFQAASAVRLDFVLNKGGWVFEEVEPRYTIALVAGDFATGTAAEISVAGPADSLVAFSRLDDDRVKWSAVELRAADFAVPLVPDSSWGELFKHCYAVAERFDADMGDWRAVAWSELHATNDRKSGLLTERTSGWPVYSGDSFDLWEPEHNAPPFHLAERKGLAALQQKREGSSVWRREFRDEVVADSRTLPQLGARILFRDVSRSTDSRTLRACLVPPKTFATNKAPSLLFPRGDERAQAYVLGVLCSLPFDWIARRRVETNVNFFILDSLPFPRPEPRNAIRKRISELSASLACIDERFVDFARACRVPVGTLSGAARENAIAEIDALVACLYRLTPKQLEIVFMDFPTTDAGVPETRRAAVRRHFANLSAP